MPCTGAPVYFAGFFRCSLKWFWKNCGLCGCFFAVFFRCSVQGSNKAFLQGSVDIPSAGAWKNRGMCPCFFWLPVGEKADLSKNIARCGHMCQWKLGCSALSRQPGLVFCEVQGLAVWNYLSLAFESARVRALRRCCLDSFWVRARARTWSDQTTQRKTCGSFSANTNDKRQKTRLLAFVPSPHRCCCFFLFALADCLASQP